MLKFPSSEYILGQPYAQAKDEIQACTGKGIRSGLGLVAFSGVADGGTAGAGDDSPILAGDTM